MEQQRLVVERTTDEPGCLVQLLWFVFVGWWLGGVAVSVAWFLNTSIIGLPFGLIILDNIPKIIALQSPRRHLQLRQEGTSARIVETEVEQHNILLRAAYFLLVGWWWSGVWLSAAYFLCALIITMPLGFAMFRLTPAMTTLRRY